jgi:hypothetical protein
MTEPVKVGFERTDRSTSAIDTAAAEDGTGRDQAIGEIQADCEVCWRGWNHRASGRCQIEGSQKESTYYSTGTCGMPCW